MCKDCEDLPLDIQHVLAALFVAGMEFTRETQKGQVGKANRDMDTFLSDLLDDMPQEGIKALMGTLILMSMDELHPVYHRVRQHYAQSN